MKLSNKLALPVLALTIVGTSAFAYKSALTQYKNKLQNVIQKKNFKKFPAQQELLEEIFDTVDAELYDDIDPLFYLDAGLDDADFLDIYAMSTCAFDLAGFPF